MWLTILSNPRLIAAVIGSLLLFYAGWYVKGGIDAHNLESALNEQKAALTSECQELQTVTKEANDALQKSRDAISSKLAALKLQHPASCVPIASETKLPTGGAEHAGRNGVNSDWLRHYAASCEEYRSEVIACVNFIDRTWTELGK